MNLESDDTDNDENILFDNDISTDDSEHGENSKNMFIEHQKKPSNIRKNIFEKILFFSEYIFLYLLRIRFSLQVRLIHLHKKHHSFVLI